MSRTSVGERADVNLLPGPVAIRPEVREAFLQAPVSHRGVEFVEEMAALRERLGRLTSAPHVAVLVGSGTLANDAVGAQLSLRGDRGVVVSTGEFGERLLDHARRWRLDFSVHERPWGEAPDPLALDAVLAADSGIGWLWAVHCETSTGVVADLPSLEDLCRRHRVDLCLDAVSSVGTMPVDFSGVHLAAGASNKGLASYPGLALVFSDHARASSTRIPRYLDLGAYEARSGVPYTHSSNLVRALAAALDRLDEAPEAAERAYAAKARRTTWLRAELERLGFTVMAPPDLASPAVLTLVPPKGRSAPALGEAMEGHGIFLSWRSAYLVRRNLVQICLMGDATEKGLRRFLSQVAREMP